MLVEEDVVCDLKEINRSEFAWENLKENNIICFCFGLFYLVL